MVGRRSVLAGSLSCLITPMIGKAARAAEGPQTVELELATLFARTYWYFKGPALARMLGEKASVAVSARPSDGFQHNLKMLRTGEVALALLPSQLVWQAFEGVSEFEGARFPELRILGPVAFRPYYILVRAEAGIRSLKDFADRPWMGDDFYCDRAIMRAAGLTDADFTNHDRRLPEKTAVDVFIFDSTVTLDWTLNWTASKGYSFELYSMTVEEQSRVVAASIWTMPYVVPAGSLPSRDRALNTVADGMMVVCTASLPDDVAYRLTGALAESAPELAEVKLPGAIPPLEDTVIPGIGMPLHPGAERWYRERRAAR